jgi:LPPG:FO 2-phospho-L-lactate transferase
MSVAVLAGGVGAARFLQGLVQIIPPDQITAVVNTGDDVELYGLHVSPDLDTVMYALSGLSNEETGWGIRGDTFECLTALGRYGEETWFRLGDRDLATHIRRTNLLHAGLPLSRITRRLSDSLGVATRILPMTDDRVRTTVLTDDGALPFQDYFVKRHQRDEVRSVRFDGIEQAHPTAGVVDSLQDSDLVIIAPSNPFVSIAPILAMDGIRPTLQSRRKRVVGISPIIGGAAVKGPAARMLGSMGHDVSALGVARLYRDVVGTFILDEQDVSLEPAIRALGIRVVIAPTLMTDLAAKRRLAEIALEPI